MIITNFNDQYLKVASDYLQEFLDGDFTSIVVTGNKNCCTSNGAEVTYTDTIDGEEGAKWKLDLSTPVGLNAVLQELNVQNFNTLSVFNVLGSAIDLGYVSANCVTEPCTLETFDSYFNPLFKDAIDDWFTAQGITSNVSISFDGNTVIVEDLPANFIMYNAAYGSDEPYTKVYFTYGSSATVFIVADGILISPSFFEETLLTDGVYKVTLKFLREDNSYVLETNCAFVDIETKCQVAAVLQNILKESLVKGSEKVSTVIHLLHYGLVNGSNCGCNCVELCQVYRELVALLESVDPNITNDCGC